MVGFLAGAAHADGGAAAASSGGDPATASSGGAPRSGPSRGASGLDWDAGGDEGKGAL